jgi:glycosyltransferase involved in cell wall biosynthesis
VDYLSFYVLAIRRAFQLGRMDVCVALTTPPFIGLVGALLRLRRGTRLVLWSMDVYPQIAAALGVIRSGGWGYLRLAKLASRLYHAADRIIALGDGMKRRLASCGAPAQRIGVVHNWVPREAVNPRPPAPSPPVRIMYSGNLGLGHELETLLRAAAELNDSPAWQLEFVGHGKRKSRLESLAAELGISHRVSFRPPVSLEELGDHLARSHIQVLSQRPGTQGLIVPSKLYGILAAARPAVYIGPTDTEVADILRESGGGRIVPAGDVPAAAGALAELIADGSTREKLGRNGRAYYETHFGRERSVRALTEMIESLEQEKTPT